MYVLYTEKSMLENLCADDVNERVVKVGGGRRLEGEGPNVWVEWEEGRE